MARRPRRVLRLFPCPSTSSCDSTASGDLPGLPETGNLLITAMDPQQRNAVSPLAPPPQEAAHLAQESGGRAHLEVDLNLSLSPPGLNLPLNLNLPPPEMDLNPAHLEVDLPLAVNAQAAVVEATESVKSARSAKSVNNYERT